MGELQNSGSLFGNFKAKLLVAGTDEHGQVSEASLVECLKDTEVKQCFEAHGIDNSEAISMLRLLGTEGIGGQPTIDVDEFIVALLVLKGPRGKEMVPYWQETKNLSTKLNHFMRFANDHFMHQEAILNRQSLLMNRPRSCSI